MRVKIPTNTREVNELLGRINACKRKLERKETTRKRRISAVNKVAKDDKAPVKALKKKLEKAIATYLSKNKAALLRKWGKKSLELLQGLVGWARPPMSIIVAKGQNESIAKGLWKKRSKRRFVRRKVTYTLKKEALLESPEIAHAIDGITVRNIGRQDRMFIKAVPKEK